MRNPCPHPIVCIRLPGIMVEYPAVFRVNFEKYVVNSDTIE
jgi:hypothetical protein